MQVASEMSSSLSLLEIPDFCKYELLETMPGLLRYKTKVLMGYAGYWSFWYEVVVGWNEIQVKMILT